MVLECRLGFIYGAPVPALEVLAKVRITSSLIRDLRSFPESFFPGGGRYLRFSWSGLRQLERSVKPFARPKFVRASEFRITTPLIVESPTTRTISALGL